MKHLCLCVCACAPFRLPHPPPTVLSLLVCACVLCAPSMVVVVVGGDQHRQSAFSVTCVNMHGEPLPRQWPSANTKRLSSSSLCHLPSLLFSLGMGRTGQGPPLLPAAISSCVLPLCCSPAFLLLNCSIPTIQYSMAPALFLFCILRASHCTLLFFLRHFTAVATSPRPSSALQCCNLLYLLTFQTTYPPTTTSSYITTKPSLQFGI